MSERIPDVLEGILQSTREELRRRKRAVPLRALEQRLAPSLAEADGHGQVAAPSPVRSLHGALTKPGIAVIAEFKRRSPSAGTLRDGAQPREIVGAYERGGASAVSVLTEEPQLRRIAGGPASVARGLRAAGAAQGLRRSTSTS